jgi:hypothetical protein
VFTLKSITKSNVRDTESDSTRVLITVRKHALCVTSKTPLRIALTNTPYTVISICFHASRFLIMFALHRSAPILVGNVTMHFYGTLLASLDLVFCLFTSTRMGTRTLDVTATGTKPLRSLAV